MSRLSRITQKSFPLMPLMPRLPWMRAFLLMFGGICFFLLLITAAWLLCLPTSKLPERQSGAAIHLDVPIISARRRVLSPKEDKISRGKIWVESLSWEPRAFLYHNFLTIEECEYLIAQATPHMEKSTVVDSKTGGSMHSRVRTSSGMFFVRGQNKILNAIEERIADFTYIPIDHGEGIQVLHYEAGQKYDAHFDYFHDSHNIKNGGQRQATMLMYLSDVEAGGETVFPSANVNKSMVTHQDGLSECGRSGLAVKPKRGDALLFWSMRPDASLDPASLHGSCPVIHGDKWSATKWMHVDEYKM